MSFIPQVEEILAHAKAEGKHLDAVAEIEALIAKTFEMEEHKWFTGNESPEIKAARKEAQEEFKKRYKK